MSLPLITLRDLHFSYAGGLEVLKGVSFDLHPGERVALTGSNGAGKSTLLRLINGLEKPDQGQIEAFGSLRQQEKDFREVRVRAGLVFQDPDDQLFCPTVAEDLAFGPLNLGKSHQEVMDIVGRTLSLLHLEDLAHRITHKLSGGQKRLVALATVMALEPDVLLLDEPTNDLDRETKQRLIAILTELPLAMVIVSHNHHFLNRVATRQVELSEGRLFEAAEEKATVLEI
ncbi:ABC transporter ATP-binding protein [Kiloniella laminariae]|uniref:ABC transporter ATP-binding protein n=1 Tax=Kiloniella laminariae TaxID=454162 RepID=A0ABT4LPI2_9PROT|nr:ABC transporter ATP-binding protein [Kiloniella laminariae]MCZ4283023.1 ABC transporter ATP-binding protein [Kiloniella laminariae]